MAEHASGPVEVTAELARPVRHSVLRPGQPAERLVYPGDDDPRSLHLGVRGADGGIVAVASFYDEPIPGADGSAFRVRGMATLEEHRGRGHGRRLVEAGLRALGERHAGETPALWCNARTSAAGYYAGLGFQQLGEEFEIPEIGPHVVMVRDARLDRTEGQRAADTAR